MNILCDTCSVLMLIRIAPDMFVDERFDCVTVQEVCEEIFRTQKFKTRYPWRTSYKDKIRPYGVLRNTGEDFELHLAVVRQIVDSGQTSLKTGRSFGLSSVDKKIAAYVAAYGLDISSTDNSLIDDMQRVIEDWDKNGEPVQPAKDKKNFFKVTGVKYTGP